MRNMNFSAVFSLSITSSKLYGSIFTLSIFLIIHAFLDFLSETRGPTKYGILRAEVINDDLYAAVDLAIDKLEGQIRKQKTRLQRKNKEGLAAAFLDSEDLE